MRRPAGRAGGRAGPKLSPSGRRAHRAHVELGHAERRHRGPVESAPVPFPRECPSVSSRPLDGLRQQVHRALVEVGIVLDGSDDLAVLDQVDAVFASDRGHQQRLVGARTSRTYQDLHLHYLRHGATLRWRGRINQVVGNLIESDGPYCSVANAAKS